MVDPLELEHFRASMRTNRDASKLKSHAYGLIYDAMGWTKTTVTPAMLEALYGCLDVINEYPYDFAQEHFHAVKQRLIAAGFATAPREE